MVLSLNFQTLLKKMLKSGWRATIPSPIPLLALLPPKISDKSLFLFKLARKINKYTSRDDKTPTAHAVSVLSYISYRLLIHEAG